MVGKYKILAIPDLHFPFANHYLLTKLYRAISKLEFDVIINLGDLLDQYVFSKYKKDLSFMNPKAEILKGLQRAHDFWNKIHRISPKSKRFQLKGNHDERLMKRILEKMPEIKDIFEERINLYDFEDVEVMKSERDYVEIDNIVYCHGWHSVRWKHVKHFGKSVVHAHTHKANMIVKNDESTDYKLMFELDCGNLINSMNLPFNYTPSTFTKWKAGYGIIDKGIPHLVRI